MIHRFHLQQWRPEEAPFDHKKEETEHEFKLDCSTHLIDLVKARMQLQGEAPTPLLASSSTPVRPAFAFHIAAMDMVHNHLSPPPKLGPISIGAKIVRTEGVT
ncbi:hypothetical protein QQ045_023415 [Rhodiola kirilowii]